ncbi:MAG: Gfo/Idh/MocA family oxidoreductase [Lachnospiraceae bacterium]|nr:Gfo/Idh/MocA family oxidoreductase [Lachnospiraceae bacterium]
MEKLKVAVISCGMISNKAHIPAYLTYPDKCEVVAVSDMNEETARATAERWGIPHWYKDTEEMLAKEKPDLVSVCVPNGFHKEMTMLSLSYGAHVACEKPVALTYKDAKEMYEEAARLDKTLMACQVLRYNPEYQFAREMHDNGTLGDVYYSEFSLIRRRGVPKWGAFHKKSASGGGALCDLGVHMIDAALWVMGNPEVLSVSGTTSSYLAKNEKDIVMSLAESGAPDGVFTRQEYKPEEFEVEEFAAGTIRLANGGSMNFKTSWAVNLPPEYSMSLAGTKAGILLPEMKLLTTMGRYQADIEPRVFAEEAPFASEVFPGHFQILDNLMEHIRNGEELVVKPEQTLTVTGIIEAFYRSAEEKKEINLCEISR